MNDSKENKYDKLEKMRADIQKDKDKVAKILEQIKVKEAKLKEAEALRIVADVEEVKMSPEELGKVLELIREGKLKDLLNGKTNAYTPKKRDYNNFNTSTEEVKTEETEIKEETNNEAESHSGQDRRGSDQESGRIQCRRHRQSPQQDQGRKPRESSDLRRHRDEDPERRSQKDLHRQKDLQRHRR